MPKDNACLGKVLRYKHMLDNNGQSLGSDIYESFMLFDVGALKAIVLCRSVSP